MRRGDLLFFISCLSLLMAPAVSGADDYKTWSYSQKIFLNTTAPGPTITRPLINIPVLIRLNTNNFKFFSQMQIGGTDIRFARNDSIHLSYQIDRWRVSGLGSDSAEIWVRLDTLFANNYTQSISMYWGKPTAFDSSNGSSVFALSNGFISTYHLGGSLGDATAGNTGIDSNTVDTATGIIGRARAFNGSSQYFTIGDVADRPSGTISFWFRPKAIFNSSSTTQGIYCKKADNSMNATLSLRGNEMTSGRGTAGCIMTKIENNSAAFYDSTSTTSWISGTWYNVVWTWKNGADSLYVNGALQGSSANNLWLAGTAIDEIGRSAYDSDAQGISVYKYFNGTIDEFRVESNMRTSDWVKLCYENQVDTQKTLVTSSGTFCWDMSSISRYQRGSGTWGTSWYWSRNGYQLTSWPGRGYTAQFDTLNSPTITAHTITVSGTQYLDSLRVLGKAFTFTGGSLDFGSKSGIFIPATITTTIGSVIAGTGGLSKYAGGSLNLTGTNSYTGPTVISGGTVSVSLLASGGSNSNIGASANDAGNLVIDSATLVFTGAAQSCNRLFSIGTRGAATITANGSGALSLNNTGAMGFSGSGVRSLILNGSNTGNNTLAAAIVNGTGGATSVTKNGTGKWVLTGTSTYTGATTVSAGTLVVNGILAAGSAVTFAAGTILSGSGNLAGTVSAGGATILPGNDGPGKLSLGALTLDSASRIDLDLGSLHDSIVVAENLTLDGIVNIIPAAGFATGTYPVFTYGGTLKNDTLTAVAPIGRKCTFVIGAGTVDAVITARLFQLELPDTSVLSGQSVTFKDSAIGTGTLSYKWQRKPSDSVGTGMTLTIASVTSALNGASYRCIVQDSFSSDTSRWAVLTVLDTPRVTQQPHDTAITVGGDVTFSVTIADTNRASYSWRKVGATGSIFTGRSYVIAATILADSGDFYCLVTNPVSTVSTDTVHLSIKPLPPEARFGYSPHTGNAPLEVSFFDSSTGAISSRRWEFGDGTTDTATNPKHLFTSVGRYGIRLIVTGPGGSSTTDTAFVTVNYPPPGAHFSFSPGAGLAPLDVSFIDNSTGPITTRRWYFGDGSTDTAANPKHTYKTPGLFTVALAVTGPGGGYDSLVKKDSISVLVKGQNPLRMHANHVTGNKVVATIERVDLLDTALPAPRCDSVGLWFATGVTPLKPENATRIAVYPRASLNVESLIDTINLPLTDSIAGLMTGVYWDDGTISEFLPVNGCVVELDGDRDTTLVARLTKLAYDSMTSSLRVAWCFDTALFPGEIDVGIGCSLDSAPSSMSGDRIITSFSECTDTMIVLNEPLRFDTLYHVALFVRRSKVVWSGFNNVSYDTVRTGHPFRQIVSFVNNKKEPVDTARAFNDRFIIWKDNNDNAVQLADTVEVYRFTPPDGFVVAATPVRFVKAGNVLPLNVGFKLDSLPAGISKSDVRIYRDSAGLLLACFGTAVDSNRIISLHTDDLRRPLIAMVDRNPPKVTLVKKPDTIAFADRDLVDSIRISDNVANVRWSFLYGKGSEVPRERNSAELRDTAVLQRFVVSKDSGAISSESGLRAWLIVNDAVHCDTIDFSRQVFRDSSDKSTTSDNRWFPLYATALLAATDPDSNLIPYANSKADKYDGRYVRLFRWIETPSNIGKNTEKWVEYDNDDAANRQLFELTPGRLFWLKTRGNIPFDLGDARTLSLKDTFGIVLPARQFTDIGVPYRFGIRIRDILRASGGRADSIRFFQWIFDSTSSRFTLDPLYVATMPDKKNPSAQLDFGRNRGYCLYNPYDSALTIRIPPLPAVMSTQGGSAKIAADKGWCAKFIAGGSGDGPLPQIYLGYAPNLAVSEYPVTPSFGMVRMSVFDRVSGQFSGHYIAADAEGGLVKELRIANTSDSTQHVAFKFQNAGGFPENYTALLYDAAAGTFSSEGTVTVAPNSTVSRWCSIGDAGWHTRFVTAAAKFVYGLRRIYPNPARSIVNIGFTIPLDAQGLLKFVVFDLRGRRIWEKQLSALQVTRGVHVVSWNGRDNRQNPVGAGMYLVRMSVVADNGKVLSRFERQVTYLP